MSSMTLLSESDLIAVDLSFDEMLTLIEQAYVLQAEGQVDVPTKIGVHPDYPKSFLHAMPAWVGGPEPSVGMKWIAYYPGMTENGLPDSTGVIVLNDPETGQPVCMMEGMYLTFLRTAACAAVAAKRLIQKPKTMALLGCGGLGLRSLQFMRHVFPSLETVYVSSKRPESREQFCADMREDGCQLVPVNSPEEAIAHCDLIVTSVPPTSAPPVKAGMLREGSLFIPLDILNSWDDQALGDFDQFVVDNVESFPGLIERKMGHDALDKNAMLSTQGVISQPAMTTPTTGRTFIGVCGIASVDISIAWTMYKRAQQRGLGTPFQIR